jgi:predicted aconitase
VRLRDDERAMLAGAEGEGVALAMRVVLVAARALGAGALRPVSRAHVDSCLYHGPSSLDFLERLRAAGARVRVPTTLNVGLLDLLRPARASAREAHAARALMEGYAELGCSPTYTCAPYQLPDRPRFGEQIAWAESNAIVFANSVLGARTNRYGDLVDVCAAVTGLVPDAGLHRTEARAATVVFDVSGLPAAVRAGELLPPLLGHVVGRRSADAVPAIVGLPPDTGEDALKALGAAAASTGAVALFHAVGITPEAPTLEAALRGRRPARVHRVELADLEAARAELGVRAGRLAAVAVGTPHASRAELRRLAGLLDGQRVSPRVGLYVSTSRAVAAAEPAAVESIERAGAAVVRDTCTYFGPALRHRDGVVMTNSAKWAHYAPGNLGVSVAFGTWAECVHSAVSGELQWEPLA